MAAERRIAALAALFGDLIIAILGLTAGLAARRAEMLAEAAYSFSDAWNQIALRDHHVLKVLAVQSTDLGPDAVLIGIEPDLVEGRDDVKAEETVHRLEESRKAAVPELRSAYIEPRRPVQG